MYILRQKKNVWLGETQGKEVGFFKVENVEEVPDSELTEGEDKMRSHICKSFVLLVQCMVFLRI